MSAIKSILKKMRDLYIFTFANITFKKPQYIQDSIIILRNDAIGDYLLFRNFLHEIRDSYPKYKITLLGNVAWSELSLHFDKEIIDDFIFFNPQYLARKPLYAVHFLQTLKNKKYDIFINAVHSRDTTNFLLSRYINANSSFAPQGDYINTTQKTKIKNDKIYTKIYPSKKEILFEFYRNMEFCQNFLDKKLKTKLELDSTKLIPFKSLQDKFKLQIPYSILFIGASTAFRKWNVESFAQVGIHLIENYHQNIVICGGKDDKENAEILQEIMQSTSKKYNKHIYNIVGITNLLELASVVYNGNHLISNETSCAHLGAILDTTITIVVSNGNHLGRFIPYPKELRDKYYPVFHHFISNNPSKYEELSNAYAYKSTLDINEITPHDVIKIIDLTLQKERK
ncbi:MAG: glycosyltransferase family 9 protein [Helicobacteraceae bacterium]|nr:glycosyltransferase family 9 protein [Helicobacteraceae bacterium]